MESIEIDFVKPEKSSLQKLYIGEGWMRRTGLKPGNIVLINRSFIARVFLHRIREVSSGICSTGSQIQNLGELLPHLTPQQGLQQSTLEKLNLTTVGSISVVLVLTKKIEDMEGYSEILRDVLHNVCFVNNTTVLLEENTVAKLHHISAVQIHLDKSGFSYKINRLTNIKIARVYTTRYIHRMKKTKSAPLVGGVEGLYSKLYKCLRQKNQHILLSGPSGCGKGSLVNRLAADLEWPVISQDCSELGSGSGALEQIFDEAEEISAQDPDNPGTILVLRNIETAGGKKGIHLLQGISKLSSYLDKYKPSDNIVVVGTTTKPQEVSPGLRRPGRLGVEFFMKVPTQDERLRILECLEEQLKLNLEAGYLEKIAGCTRGYLASDLALLTRRILWADPGSGWTGIQKCIDITVPSGLRLGLGWVNLETISWDSIGGMEDVKRKLERAVEWPIRNPEAFTRLGIKPSKGLLLYGPPGCGKTRLVRAAASNIGATLLSVSGAEIFSPYVGDSEKAVVELFRQARLAAPTILFIDEIDSLVSARDMEGTKTNHSDKVLSALLTEMDGMGGKEQDGLGSGQVLVIGATNRPGVLDSALTRPGRLDSHIYIPPPDRLTRMKILETYLNKVPNKGLDLENIAERTENYSGADLENLVKESVLHLLSQEGMDALELKSEHMETVLNLYRPSLPHNLSQYML